MIQYSEDSFDSSTFVLPPMLSPTLPPWCELDDVPDVNLSDSAAKRLSQTSRMSSKATIKKSVNSNSKKSLIVTLRIKNIEKYRKIVHKELKPKKKRVSRSYSSSDESDTNSSITNHSSINNYTTSNSYSTNSSSSMHQPTSTSTQLKIRKPATLPPKPVKSVALTPPASQSVKPKRNSSATPSSSSTSTSNSKINQEQRQSNYQLLIKKSRRWSYLARNQKHKADEYSHKDPLLACVVAMDALLSYVVAFDYEDRAEHAVLQPKHLRSWITLIPYMDWVINIMRSKDCRELIGLCYQIRALIHLKMYNTYQEQITKYNAGDSHKELEDVTSNMIKANEASVKDFKIGMRELPLDTIERRFPKTWKTKTRTIQPVSKHEGGFRPMEDPFYLPLHIFSSLQEAAALGYSLTKEWADQNKVECDWALVRGLKG